MFKRRAQPDPQAANREAAEALRQLASGLITNEQFEDRIIEIDGLTHEADEIAEFAYSFCNDNYEHRLRGKYRLSKLQRQVFAHAVLFLRSGISYEHTRDAKWLWARQRRSSTNYFTQIVFTSFSQTARDLRVKREREDERLVQSELIDDRIWPFARRQDLDHAKQTTRLLAT